ncbi:MAG: BREX system Lon protease-like protein BrxL [Nitrososphaerales archaeon]
MSEIDSKVLAVFGTYAVNKRQVQNHELGRLPRFIAEYLVAKFTGNESGPDLSKLADFVIIHFPELKDRDKILHDLMTTGTYALMDEFKVETDIKKGKHKLIIPCINVKDAQIVSTILDDNADLLRSGMWGIATLKYMPQEDNGQATDTSPILMTRFTPFQVTNVSLHDFASKRRRFSRDEWIQIILRSIGLNPDAYNDHQKMLLLCRLVPLVEPNSNILELGPKATGKTYLYRNISYYTRVISGGRVSPATLFYNISTKSVGEIGVRDCVVLDEISKLTFSNGEEMVGKLKDYMVDGFFERGPKKAHATCSLVFMGNMEFGSTVPVPADAVSSLPTFMHDSAIIDRIHAFISGWELPKIRQSSEHLASGYGIVADYLSEVFHQLSLQSYSNLISERVRIEGDITIRDEKAIKKTASGILKLLCPDRQCDDSDIAMSMDVAVKGRERITVLLNSISPAEFEKKTFKYTIV